MNLKRYKDESEKIQKGLKEWAPALRPEDYKAAETDSKVGAEVQDVFACRIKDLQVKGAIKWSL